MPYIHNESGCGQYNISSNVLEELIKSHRSVYVLLFQNLPTSDAFTTIRIRTSGSYNKILLRISG